MVAIENNGDCKEEYIEAVSDGKEKEAGNKWKGSIEPHGQRMTVAIQISPRNLYSIECYVEVCTKQQ